MSEFDLIAEMAGKDIRKAIYDGIIPADIAITTFGVYGFSEDEKKYFQEVMNRFFYNDVTFKLTAIPESQTIQVEELDDKLIVKKGASKNKDLKKFAESINSKHYGEIYIYSLAINIYMKFLVHDADTGDVVWSSSWSVKDDDGFTAELGYALGYNILSKNMYQYLHMFFGARSAGLGEFGITLDLGIYQPADILFVSDRQNLRLEELGATLMFATKVSLNFIELSKSNYNGVDVYWIFKPGMKVDFLLYSNRENADPLYIPKIFFSGNVGLGLGFRRINIDLLFDANPQGGFLITTAIYYKF